MIAQGWIRYAWAILAAAFALAPAAFLVQYKNDVRVVTRTTPAKPPGSALALVTLLGAPGQTIAGADLNPNLAGAQCGAYSFKDGLALVCR